MQRASAIPPILLTGLPSIRAEVSILHGNKGAASLSTAVPRLLTPGTAGKVAVSDGGTGNGTLALTFRNSAGEATSDYAAIKTALDSSNPFWPPTRYETQLNLPPGEYDLEVALSSVALCKSLRSALSLPKRQRRQISRRNSFLC